MKYTDMGLSFKIFERGTNIAFRVEVHILKVQGRRYPAPKRRCFTLIELLVVISIVALLMAILIPFLRKAKEQAKSTVCMNNLRQIGLAAHFYAETYDQFIPRGTCEQQDPTSWFQLFMPFLSEQPEGDDYRNVKMYRCPSYPNKEQVVCYVINDWEIENPRYPGKHQVCEPTRLTVYKRLSTTIYLCDNEDGPWRPIVREENDEGWHSSDVWQKKHLPLSDYEIKAGISKWMQKKWEGPRVAHKRHRKGCNCLYADWHVDYVDAEDMRAETKSGETNVKAIDMWRFKK